MALFGQQQQQNGFAQPQQQQQMFGNFQMSQQKQTGKNLCQPDTSIADMDVTKQKPVTLLH